MWKLTKKKKRGRPKIKRLEVDARAFGVYKEMVMDLEKRGS